PRKKEIDTTRPHPIRTGARRGGSTDTDGLSPMRRKSPPADRPELHVASTTWLRLLELDDLVFLNCILVDARRVIRRGGRFLITGAVPGTPATAFASEDDLAAFVAQVNAQRVRARLEPLMA